jgi:hypothetical protein
MMNYMSNSAGINPAQRNFDAFTPGAGYTVQGRSNYKDSPYFIQPQNETVVTDTGGGGGGTSTTTTDTSNQNTDVFDVHNEGYTGFTVPSSGYTPAVPYNPASIGTPGQMSNSSYTGHWDADNSTYVNNYGGSNPAFVTNADGISGGRTGHATDGDDDSPSEQAAIVNGIRSRDAAIASYGGEQNFLNATNGGQGYYPYYNDGTTSVPSGGK